MKEWKKGSDMSEGRVNFCLNYIDNSILVIGGYDGEKVLSSCELFDTQT